MESILWDLCEKAEEKAKVYEFYHLNSEHTERTQCYNAPKMNYALEKKDTDKKEVVWTVPYLEDIKDSGFTLKDALMRRRTSWEFGREALSEKELEMYLAYSFGINDKKENLKTYPSGGRLYPIEIYLVPTRKLIGANAMFRGDYCVRYNVHTRNMEKQADFDVDAVNSLVSATDIGNLSFDNAQFLVCLVGDADVMKKKYHSLTYRLMHDECGHIGQNIMLVAGMLDLKVVPLGGFFEERIRDLLDLTNTGKRVLYVLAVG